MSLKHRKANRIFRKVNADQEELDRCDCCGKYVSEDSDAGYFCYSPVKELQFLGAGVPLMFIFIQNAILTMIALISVFAMYAFISNIANDSCERLGSDCRTDIFNKFSINNKLFSEVDISIQASLVLAMTVIWAFLIQYFIYRFRKT